MGNAGFKLAIDRGTTFRLSLRPEDQSGEVFTPEDLTGHTFEFHLADPTCTDRWYWRSDHGDETLTVSDGWIELNLNADMTKRFSKHRKYEWRVLMIHPSGDVEQLISGPAYFNGGDYYGSFDYSRTY